MWQSYQVIWPCIHGNFDARTNRIGTTDLHWTSSFHADDYTSVYNTVNAGMEMCRGRKGEKTKDAARSSSITEENVLNIYWAKTR